MTLENRLAQEPISIPGNPYAEVFRRFGRDEAIAGALNIVGTAVTAAVTPDPFILSVAGPIIEKAGFFPAHLKEAWDIYRTTPSEKREPLRKYISRAFKGGFTSLLEDVLIHDPLYTGMMYGGLQLYPQAPAWMLATISFGLAAAVVAAAEVTYHERQYRKLGKEFQKLGFGLESYFECRFFMKSEQDPEDILSYMKDEFNLSQHKKGQYFDRYLVQDLPSFSGRTPKLRLRRRKIAEEEREVRTLQIVYERASEMDRKKAEQFRYYPKEKCKFYYRLDGSMPSSISEIADAGVRKKLEKWTTAGYKDVSFEREIIHSPDTLLVAVDNIREDQPFYVVELKVREEKRLLVEAMRALMLNFPVVQTTMGKYDIVGGTNGTERT